MPFKRRSFNRLHHSGVSLDESFGNNTLQTQCSVTSDSPLNPYNNNLTSSTNTLIDFEEHRNSTTVSVKKVTQIELANMTNIQQLNDSKVKDEDDLHIDSMNRPATVSVIRVKRLPNLNSTSENNINTTGKRVTRAISRRNGRVKITKILRKISSKTQRSCSASFISTIQQSPDNPRGVTVRRLSRATVDT